MRLFSSGTLYTCAFLLVFQIGPAFAGISCPESVLGSHCDVLSFSVGVDSATDISDLTFSVMTDGPGQVTVDSFGRVSYVPFPFVADEPVTISVSAVSESGEVLSCSTSAVITNVAPRLICPKNAEVVRGRVKAVEGIVAIDSDPCDLLQYSLVRVNPEPRGVVTVDLNTGAVTFAADEHDANGHDRDYSVTLAVSDGTIRDTCSFTFIVLHEEAFKLEIQRINNIFPGGSAKVPILYVGGTLPMGGFDFRLNYDSTALKLLSVTKGNIFSDYGWEFFDTDFDPTDTGNFEPGELRIVGLSDLGGIPGTPADVVFKLGDTIAVMEFLVSNDRNLSCLVIPIRWVWQECRDNMLASTDGETLYRSMKVFDYTGTDPFNSETGGRLDITDKCDTSPFFGGSGCVCDKAARNSGSPSRQFIDFMNGGIKMVCCGCFVTTGDLNLNGISNEFSDAEMYVDYFLDGLSAFDTLFAIVGPAAVEAATAESDVNRDGIPLTVEDLVYLIRIITGDALPLNKLTHDIDTVIIRRAGNTISSNTELGAVLIEIEGEAEASLLQKHMSMGTGLLHGNTRIIVYDIGLGKLHAGGIISTDGEIVSVKAVDYNGSRMVANFDFPTGFEDDEEGLLPRNIQLHQNYPNPFNPTTTIEFALPQRGAVELIIYNTLGRKVRVLTSGTYSAGKYSVRWDGTDDGGRQVTSGVYYYRLRAGDVVQSRKMVLLK